MPSYREIKDFVWKKYGVRIWKSCHIADVLAQHGLTSRKAHNRQNANSVRYPCPPALQPKIEDALLTHLA